MESTTRELKRQFMHLKSLLKQDLFELIDVYKDLGFKSFLIDCGNLHSFVEVCEAVFETVDAPNIYNAANWNAVCDVLSHLEWEPAEKVLIIITNVNFYTKEEHYDANTYRMALTSLLLAIVDDAPRMNRNIKDYFHTILVETVL